VELRTVLLKDDAGKPIGMWTIVRDITERKRAEELIRQQARDILEISTPVVQLWEGVLAVPLIGMLDSQRTQQITERLLNRIVETRSPFAIIDLTGVPTVDTQTGRHLIDTITAVRLLGTQTLLTGIRPEIAQTLVHLGIDLTGIVTRSSLASGLGYALERINNHQSTKAKGKK
jgi:rsbT co-antagonist protein RsbR